MSDLRVILIVVLTALPLAAQVEKAAEAPKRGTIEGIVRWSGTVFEPREVLWPEGVRGVDLELERILKDRVVVDEALMVNAERGIANCVVLLNGHQLPERPPVPLPLKIEGLRFQPHAFVVTEGRNVVVRNQDAIEHEVTMKNALGAVVKKAVVPAGGEHDFGRPPAPVAVFGVTRFPFMSAMGHSTGRTPAVVTDRTGKFFFRGVPAGQASLTVRHELLGQAEVELTGEPGPVEVRAEAFVRGGKADSEKLLPFGEGENPVLRINGVEVPRDRMERLVAYYRAEHAEFTMPDSLLRQFAVRRILLPVAAALDHHKKRASELVLKARLVRLLVSSGRSFEEVARIFSEERHSLIPLRRRSEYDAAVGEAVFRANLNEVVGPIFSSRGLHVFKLEDVEASASGGERRSIRHVFLPYAGDRALSEHDRLVARLVERARVEILDAELREAVPRRNRK